MLPRPNTLLSAIHYTKESIIKPEPMKKEITLTLIIFLQLLWLNSTAQQLTNDWRLTKISRIESGGNPVTTEYAYDNTGRLTTINYFYNNNFGSKWDGSAVKDFVYDKGGHIASYAKYDITGNLQYSFTYDNKNRIVQKKIYKVSKDAKTETRKIFQLLNYSYKGNQIIESRMHTLSGKVADETTYTFNDKGNIIGHQRRDMSTMKIEKYICGKFDDKPNPLRFTGADFYTNIQSKHNGEEGYWEGTTTPVKTESTYDSKGLVKKTVITEKFENNIITTEYNYSYAEIKPIAAPGKK